MVLFTIFVFFKVPETKNKTFEEIAHAFAPGQDLEVEEMIDEEDGVFDDALPNDLGDQEDHRLVSFFLRSGQESPEGKPPQPPDSVPLDNTNFGKSNGPNHPNGAPPTYDVTMAIPPGVPYIDASPASERTNPTPSPRNPGSKESLLEKSSIKTTDSNPTNPENPKS